jgi:hypothetical protein
MRKLLVILTIVTLVAITILDNSNQRTNEYSKILPIIKNEVSIYDYNSQKTLFLNDILEVEEGYTFKILKFALFDIDNDMNEELLLSIGFENNIIFTEILKYTKDEVVGFYYSIKAMQEIKEDKTFIFSSGASYYGWGKIFYRNGKIEVENIGLYDGDKADTKYFLNDKPVSEEMFLMEFGKRELKQGIKWIEFSLENLEAVVSK